jgi:predicted deacetylase
VSWDGLLAVALHDVEPAAQERCAEIRAWLRERGVERATLLVIPAAVDGSSAAWLRGLVDEGDAVAQHGYRHRRTAHAGPARALLAHWQGGDAAEFPGLDEAATQRALEAGHRILATAGLEPRGFVAPAYSHTRVLRHALDARFHWWATLWRVHRRGAAPLLAPALCLGTSTALKRTASPPLIRAAARRESMLLRLDVHPADFDHPAHVSALEDALAGARRRRAITYDELVGA